MKKTPPFIIKAQEIHNKVFILPEKTTHIPTDTVDPAFIELLDNYDWCSDPKNKAQWTAKAAISIVNSLLTQRRLIFTITREAAKQVIKTDDNWKDRLGKNLGMSDTYYSKLLAYLTYANIIVKVNEIGHFNIYELVHPEIAPYLQINREDQMAEVEERALEMTKNMKKRGKRVKDGTFAKDSKKLNKSVPESVPKSVPEVEVEEENEYETTYNRQAVSGSGNVPLLRASSSLPNKNIIPPHHDQQLNYIKSPEEVMIETEAKAYLRGLPGDGVNDPESVSESPHGEVDQLALNKLKADHIPRPVCIPRSNNPFSEYADIPDSEFFAEFSRRNGYEK